MSIPPLVCSTPPPPDQCEDDKEVEDYNVHYSLSQDDDDSNEYGYEDFASYNHYKTATDREFPLQPQNTHVNIASLESPTMSTKELEKPNHITIHCKMKNEDEKMEEDLDLKLERLSVHSDKENVIELEHVEIIAEEIQHQNEIKVSENLESNDKDNISVNSLSNNDSLEFKDSETPPEYTMSIVDDELEDDGKVQDEAKHNMSSNDGDVFQLSNTIEQETNLVEKTLNIPEETNSDDDFGDFDDFKCASGAPIPAVTAEVSNPWNSQECQETPVEFEAKFDAFSFEQPPSLSTDNVPSDPQENDRETNLTEDDDDFGDFDDFQSTTVSTPSCVSQSETEFNLKSYVNDEIVDKVLSSIFEEAFTESEITCESNLECLLGETWRHLLEIEERQPYMINWNSTLGQKTLLKSLGIDSRNILYGPKWGHNMPKYAANLSAAPLQPQKQVSQSEPTKAEKPPSKPADTWADPFTADGQEFTYAETLLLDLEHLMATLDQMAHNHSNLKISDLLSHACKSEENSSMAAKSEDSRLRPTELHMIPPSPAPVKPEPSIYSATLGVHPMRQISLPDTHIFTPTDSEIPRSKTIHYDCTSTVLVAETKINESALDTDFSDFQDFKDTLATNMSKLDVIQPNTVAPQTSSVTYETRVLEPIKLEPSVPTLNWPDPGEVKETFDDFSDFISNTSWGKENTETDKTNLDVNIPAVPVIKSSNTTNVNVACDGDFDVFQSAAPTSATAVSQPVEEIQNQKSNSIPPLPPSQSPSTNQTNFDFGLKNSIATDHISNTNSIPNLEPTSSQTVNNTFKPPPANFQPQIMVPSKPMTPITNSQILQPMSSHHSPSLATQRTNTSQILQPLSLESYSQINWPEPGMDFQDLSRFNPVETVPSLKGDLRIGNTSKSGSPAHAPKAQLPDDEWGDFVSSNPQTQSVAGKKQQTFVDDDEWSDFVSHSNVKPQNGLNTISFNVHSNLSMHKSNPVKTKYTSQSQSPLEVPSLNYITPKTTLQRNYADKHLNL